jgi:glycosyltransferase involved in cell wall biosynthesis
MKIAIATDAWMPQVNGVVRTLSETVNRLIARDFDVDIIAPDRFKTIACPGYREIRLAVAPRFGARKALHSIKPDLVHIATEGPIGWSARGWCLSQGVPFTTAFHTRFPDYAAVRTGLSPDRFWPIMRRFHGPSRAVLTATPALMAELAGRGIANTRLWSRGIDHSNFNTGHAAHPLLANLPRPIMLSVGRVSIEKNLDAFLAAAVAGTKVIVGDGPAFDQLKAKYPDAIFMGSLKGAELASTYAAADIFVFPSRTDTFGLVVIEALACGLPVAAFPVSGPLDIIGLHGKGPRSQLAQPVGCVDDDLPTAIIHALHCSPADAAEYGRSFDWDKCTDQFVAALTEAAARPSTSLPQESAYA